MDASLGLGFRAWETVAPRAGQQPACLSPGGLSRKRPERRWPEALEPVPLLQTHPQPLLGLALPLAYL